METEAMGKVVVPASVENLKDLFAMLGGQIPTEQVRRVDVSEALIDSGATGLMMPKKMIEALGLEPLRKKEARTIAGPATLPVYRAVRLTIQGRDCISDVAEISDDLPVIVGQVPLELMDWVVDMRGQKLIGNPDHGGEYMIDAL